MIETKEVVEYLVKQIVDKPDEVEISEKKGEHGKNIQAIRTLVSAVSAKVRKRAIIELIE